MRVHGIRETSYVAPRVQLEPGVVTGACFAGLKDEEEGIEAGG